MTILREGSVGDLVAQLQNRLLSIGFNPGTADGNFGPKTAAAVSAFQAGKGLQVDGIAGPQTLAALNLNSTTPDPNPTPIVATTITPENVIKMFPSTPIINIKTNLPFVLSALAADQLADKVMILMALGTIRAETGSFRPISEGISRFNTSPGGHPFDLYDNRADLGNKGAPDGANFKGRGFVQLTGRANYTKYSASIGLGTTLVTQPDLANDPKIASQLLARFLKDKESAIRLAFANNDLKEARRLVNGGSNGLADFTNAIQIGERIIST